MCFRPGAEVQRRKATVGKFFKKEKVRVKSAQFFILFFYLYFSKLTRGDITADGGGLPPAESGAMVP